MPPGLPREAHVHRYDSLGRLERRVSSGERNDPPGQAGGIRTTRAGHSFKMIEAA
jgi:hypothetical protein